MTDDNVLIMTSFSSIKYCHICWMWENRKKSSEVHSRKALARGWLVCLLMVQLRQRVEQQSQEVMVIFRFLGFSINRENSQLSPTRIISYLGVTIDTTLMTLTLLEEKIVKKCHSCQSRNDRFSEGFVEANWHHVNDNTAVLPALLYCRGLTFCAER